MAAFNRSTEHTTESLPNLRTTRTRIIGIVQVVVIIVLLGFAFYISRPPEANSKSSSNSVNDNFSQAPVIVEVIKPDVVKSTIQVRGTGSIVVRSYISLALQVSGRITKISKSLRDGGSFKAGELLLEIEAQDFALVLEQAKADLDSARAVLELQQAESTAARKNYELLHPGEDVPPLVAKEPQKKRSSALITAAEARVKAAELNLSRTKFSLPFDGLIVSSNIGVGQLLSQGQSFGRAFALNDLEASIAVTSEALSFLYPAIGRLATVMVGNDVWQAHVERMSAELDSRTRVATLFLSFLEPPSALPGTFVHAVMKGPTVDQSIILPDIVARSGDSVWIVVNGSLQRFSPSIVGRTDQGDIVRAFSYDEGIVVGSLSGVDQDSPVRTTNTTK